MPLIVESGLMEDGANSYADAPTADEYLSMRVDSWPYHDPASADPDPNLSKKERALVRATDWLNTLKWKSEPADIRRVMAWPREDYTEIIEAMEDDTPHEVYVIPDAVKRACMEMAALIYTGVDPLAMAERGGRVQSKTESSVGPIGAESTTWFADAPSETLYKSVVGIIEPYLAVVPGKRSGFGSVEVGRG